MVSYSGRALRVDFEGDRMIVFKEKDIPEEFRRQRLADRMRLDGKLNSVEPPLASLVDVLLGVRRWSLVSTSLSRSAGHGIATGITFGPALSAARLRRHRFSC